MYTMYMHIYIYIYICIYCVRPLVRMIHDHCIQCCARSRGVDGSRIAQSYMTKGI